MEAQLSLGDVTKSVFTSDYSSNYKTVTAGSAFCDMLTTNTIKQSISVDSSNTSDIKESEYKIKEAEKIISKNILFSIYEFNINAKYSTYSSYLGQNIHTYEYTNLTNDEVPSFKKLHMYLDQISTVLNNHKGIVSSKDTGNQLYHSLQEFIDEINDSSAKIYSLVMGGKIANVEADTFIINAEKLFKGESSFKTKKFIGDKAKIAAYFNSVKTKYLDIANSVAGYNDGLQQAIVKFNKVMDALATEYKSNYSQVALQVEYKKEELRNVLYTFAMKYFNLANILYSIKAECVHEYLNPSYSAYDDLLTIKEDYSLDTDMDFLDESSDIFEDDSMFNSTRQVDFSFRTIELEEAFFAYTIKPLLEEENGTPNQPQNPPPQNNPQGQPQQVADASKKVPSAATGSADNPASADEKNRIRKGGKIKNANWFKELWNTIMNFVKSCIEKVTFAVKKSKDKLMAIIDDLESVKKITENLEKSDDAYSFRVYNANPSETSKRINSMSIPQIHELFPINGEADLKKSEEELIKAASSKISANQGLKTLNTWSKNILALKEEPVIPDMGDELKMVYKNYFAGYNMDTVKAGFADIKNNTENKAKNNILASTLSVAQMKKDTVTVIISNIKLARIEQLEKQYNNISTIGNNYAQKIVSMLEKPDTSNGAAGGKQAGTGTEKTVADQSSARITIESVMSEYFGDLIQIHEAEEEGKEEKKESKPAITTEVQKVTTWANGIFTSANYAYQQMLDNYYNIFNALLSGELKVGENKTTDNKEEEKKPEEKQPEQDNQETQGENNSSDTQKNTSPGYNPHTGRAQPKQTVIRAVK